MLAKHDIEYVIHPLQSDRLLRVAAERLASRLLSQALGLDSPTVKQRFGFAT